MSDWLGTERNDVASDRILDAAAKLFVERGVAASSMADIARASGCSRATLYRYFDSRRTLQVAFMQRETRRIAGRIAREFSLGGDPGEQMVSAILAAVEEVRADPTLIAWFSTGDSGVANELAHSSEMLEVLAGAILGEVGLAGDRAAKLGRWLLRVVLSLLTVPGASADDERELLTLFVAPLVREIA